MSDALTLQQCGEQLGVEPRRLRRAIEQGAPVVARGRPGRSHPTLVDPQAISNWLKARGEFTSLHNLQLAKSLTATVAEAAVNQFRSAAGAHKRELALATLQQFEVTAQAIRQQLGLPPMTVDELPAEVRQLATSMANLSRSG